jgi:Protein of unknown function (DUF3570)
MQLTKPKLGRVSQVLALLTANLLATTCAQAQVQPASPDPAAARSRINDDTESDLGLTRLSTAVLFYSEAGSRVKATEPTFNATLNGNDGAVLSIGLTADSLTGATPNGAAPWKSSQTFLTPAQAAGSTATVTGASGGSKLVTIPGIGTVARSYTTAANSLPIDTFQDKRRAIDLAYSSPISDRAKISFSGGASTEHDYASISGSVGISRDFNQKNTTLSAAINLEHDTSKPIYGVPTPLSVMSGVAKGPDQTKDVASLVLGVTQVMNRRWLTQLNYSVGQTDGYQTDPYRLISVVDGVTGAPTSYLYENRPKSRLRQSVYFGNKIAIGPTITDLSLRAYHDSWGVNSMTADVSERIPITSWLYVEPEARYYSQSAANFFHDYLIAGQPLPVNASSDGRLDRFSSVGIGYKVGLDITNHALFGDARRSELYLKVQDFKQTGGAHASPTVPGLAGQNLFSGVRASSVILGYGFSFY